jgi:hypothetical protein
VHPVGRDRIARLDERNQVTDQLALERRVGLELHGHRSAAAAARASRPRTAAARTAAGEQRRRLVRRAPVRHHDDHRYGFPVGNQVVEDRTGGSWAGPMRLVAADAVQQIEHGVPLVRRIAGRQVDRRRSLATRDFRIELDALDDACRYAFAWHVETHWRRRKGCFGTRLRWITEGRLRQRYAGHADRNGQDTG